MGRILRSLLLLWFILIAAPAWATVFQYFDEEGTLIVTDNPHQIRKPRPAYGGRYKSIVLPLRDDVVYEFYPVAGSSFREAVMAVNANGPFDSREGKNYAGQTRWNSGWSYRFASQYRVEGESVRVSLDINDIEFGYNVSVLLPMLPENSPLDARDLQLWEGFLRGLLEHEHDHVKIIRDRSYRDDAVRKIAAIREITIPFDPRSDLDAAIRSAVEVETARIGHDMILRIKARNDEYDRLTEHGLKPDMREVFFSR